LIFSCVLYGVICFKSWNFKFLCIWNIGDLYEISLGGVGAIVLISLIEFQIVFKCGGWNNFEDEFFPAKQHTKLPKTGKSVRLFKFFVSCVELSFPLVAINGCWSNAEKYPKLLASAIIAFIGVMGNLYSLLCDGKEEKIEDTETDYKSMQDENQLNSQQEIEE
jgi:hypothetical protein